ncbi:MAG: squalene/phytoene synthase family protein [Gammaproteobacteria bacterium]|nr:squalene/phytoene synthase family protein [Gammaproteobacteria bacterium]
MSAAGPRRSTTRTLAALYSPPPQRALLEALFALEEEIGASLRPGLDHEVAHARLAWWREECARCIRGQAAHPLTRALLACFAGRDPAPLAGIGGLIDTAVWDLAAATFETRRELDAYCGRWADALLVPWVALGAPLAPRAAAHALGAALREAQLLAGLARDAHAGRLRLPLDELAAAALESTALARAPYPEPLARLLRARHADVRARLTAAVAALGPAAQPPLRGLMVWVGLAHQSARGAARRLPRAHPGGDDSGLLDGYRAWRAARLAGEGRFAP